MIQISLNVIKTRNEYVTITCENQLYDTLLRGLDMLLPWLLVYFVSMTHAAGGVSILLLLKYPTSDDSILDWFFSSPILQNLIMFTICNKIIH